MDSTQKRFPVPKFIIAVFLLLMIFTGMDTILAEQTFWEGRISAAPYGLLPTSGYYAASNAFPLDSKVAVTVADGSRQIEVRIVERLDVDRVFMQLSSEAAREVGLKENEVLVARVSPVQDEASEIERSLARETPYSRDPDINPAATAGDARAGVIQEYLEEQGLAVETSPVEGEVEEKGAPEIVEEEPAEKEVAEVEEAPVQEPAEEISGEAVVHALPERTVPERELSYTLPAPQMKTEEEGAALAAAEESETPAVAGSGEASAEPQVVALEPIFLGEKDYSYTPNVPERRGPAGEEAGPRISMESAEPSITGSGEVLLAQHAPELPKEEAPVADMSGVAEEPEMAEAPDEAVHGPVLPTDEREEPDEIPEDAELVLVPAEERPPEGPPTVTAEETERPPKEEESDRKRGPATGTVIGGPVSVYSNLEKGSNYLQVGAYTKLELARSMAAGLSSRYPVMIYTETGGAAPYKLMIGPLNEDESDTLLYTFTSRGYPDAFVRRGN